MGMFDYIKYGNVVYQTKDTPMQTLSLYEIRGDKLWYKNTTNTWIKDEKEIFGGHLEEVSHEWIFQDEFDGLIEFGKYHDDTGEEEEYKALFMDGKMIRIKKDET